MTTNYEDFNNLLPATAVEVLGSDFLGPFFGLPSYFNATITEGGLLNGEYDAWCIRSDRPIDLGTPYNVDVFSSYGVIPSGILPEGSQPILNPPPAEMFSWMDCNR